MGADQRGSAIITGASSGIGRALATELAARGWDLGLSARRIESVRAVAEEITRRDPRRRVVVEGLDVMDAGAVGETITALFRALGNVTLVVANAGIGGNHRVGDGTFARSRDVIATNLIGAMATVDAAVACWRGAPGPGPRRIAGITSVAGFRGLPTSSAYCASKAGLAVYLEAVRAEVRPLGIEVLDIAPGFIDTPMNRDMASRPFVVDVEDGARRIADLIERGVPRATVPAWPWSIVGWVMRNVPDALWVRVAGGLHRGRE